MFSLEKHDARISHVSIRREKHGKEGKLGMDISIAIQTVNTTLDMLQSGLRKALFKKAEKGQQMDIIAGADALVALAFPQMEPVKLDIEISGCEVTLEGNLDATEEYTTLVDVKLKDFTIKPIEGGSAMVSFKAQLQADLDELSEVVDWWMIESIRLTVVPPKMIAEQTPPVVEGDTLEQQEAAEKAEAERLIGIGKKK